MAKTATRDELLATQKLLQRAHDYVETNGFDINTYQPDPKTGQCCYIGSVRLAAGINPSPQDDDFDDAGIGDGPELRLALKVLDDVVKARIPSDERARIQVIRHRGHRVGRYVERYGFFVHEEGVPGNDEATEGDEALRVFRKALTKVYKQLEKLDAA